MPQDGGTEVLGGRERRGETVRGSRRVWCEAANADEIGIY